MLCERTLLRYLCPISAVHLIENVRFQISKAVVLLLKQVDQIIEDAKSYERDQIIMVLKRVPHLIHLYSHLVPTLHSERMKSDLRFVCKSVACCLSSALTSADHSFELIKPIYLMYVSK